MTARFEVFEDKFEGEKVAMSRTRFICLLLFFFLPTLASAVEPCAFLEFPTLFGDTITIRDGSNLTLPFRIRFSKPCPKESFEELVIRVEIVHGDAIGIFCNMRIINGVCHQTPRSSPCGCGSEEFTYQVQTIVDQWYNGLWWRTSRTEMMRSKRLFFNVYIEDEPRVIDLTFHNVDNTTNTVDKDTTVDVVCIWQSGNPPAQARLLDRHGKEMDVIGSYGLLRYTLSSVRCDDSGQYRCEAPRATENKTATLLVKCPPEITFSQNEPTTLPGGTVDLKFYVRSHTTNITDCWLNKLSHVDDSRSLQCDVISVTGSPPDLVLSVYLTNVNEADDGMWRLELTNDAGTGQADFRLYAPRLPGIKLFLTEITAVSGAPVDFGAYVRSHTTNITDCWLKKLFPRTKPRLSLQCDVNRLMGSPPDLVLSVSMDNVEEADDGFWRLELTNDQGTGHADFSLKVEPAPREESPSSIPITVPVVSSLIGAVAVVVVAVPVMFLCRRYRRGRAGVEVSQDMASNQSADLYMEVLDEAVRTVEAPPRPCQRRRLHSRPPQAAAPPSETKDPHPDRNPNLWYISSSIEGLSSSNKHKTKNAAENVAEASSSAADIASSDGYLTPRPLRNRTEDAAGGATTMLPRSDTGLPADYLTPASRQQGAEATYPENVALLPMRSETSPGASSLTPLSLPEETKNINITAVET